MKTIKTTIFVLLLLAVIHGHAQEKKTIFGIKAGLNVSNIGATDDKEFDNTNAKTGFHAGVTLDYAFTPNWYLLTGLEYTTKGTKIDLGSRDMDIKAAYVQLPLHGGFKFRVADALSVLVYLGPYFAYGLHGKSKYGSFKYDTFSKDIAKKFDCGMNFGAGLEWKKFCFGLGGEYGMVNIMEEGNSKAETRNFAISLGYKFKP